MTEIEIIRLIAKQARGRASSGLILGIGDDCAVIRPRAGEDLLITTDFVIEGVHFRRSAPAAFIGRKALARGLSDIAAMGGDARYCLVSLALPERAAGRWIDGFYRGLGAAGVPVIGGDLTRASKIACDVVVIGATPKGKAVRRDGARPGDRLYVSGALGRPWDRAPEPRLKIGRFLRGRATSAIDLSDGLAIDLHRLCLASGVAASIEFPLPVWPDAGLDRALHGGEDYELLFTLPPAIKAPSRIDGVALTRIGAIRRGRAGKMEFMGTSLEPRGWDPFA